MPKMDGYEATRAIRALENPRHRDVTIIGLSAHTQAEDIKYGLNIGMNGYITKPVSLEDLHGVFKEYLAHYEIVAGQDLTTDVDDVDLAAEIAEIESENDAFMEVGGLDDLDLLAGELDAPVADAEAAEEVLDVDMKTIFANNVPDVDLTADGPRMAEGSMPGDEKLEADIERLLLEKNDRLAVEAAESAMGVMAADEEGLRADMNALFINKAESAKDGGAKPKSKLLLGLEPEDAGHMDREVEIAPEMEVGTEPEVLLVLEPETALVSAKETAPVAAIGDEIVLIEEGEEAGNATKADMVSTLALESEPETEPDVVERRNFRNSKKNT